MFPRGEIMKKILLILFLLILTIPSYAFDIPVSNNVNIDLYGSVKAGISADLYLEDPAVTNMSYKFHPDSFLGINIGYGAFSTKLELGIQNPNTLTLDIRKLYFAINMGKFGKISLGKQFSTSTVADMYNDFFMYDQRLVGYGNASNLSTIAVQYDIIGIQIALVDLFTDVNIPSNVEKSGNFIMPRVDLAYNLKKDWFILKVFGSYLNLSTKLKYDPTTPAIGNNKTVNINAFHVGFLTKFKFKYAGFQLSGLFSSNAEIYNGVQIGGYEKDFVNNTVTKNFQPIFFTAPILLADPDDKGNIDYLGLKGITTFGGAGSFFAYFGDVATLELGFGVQMLTGDGMPVNPGGASGTENLTASSIINIGGYLNTLFHIHSNFTVGPQAGLYMRTSSPTAVKYPNMTAAVIGIRLNATF